MHSCRDFSILRYLAYIKDELLIVKRGTSSSETVLPQMMQKMEHLGASRPVVGLVIPTGYSFNLDGTNIYMTLATLFLAQATNTHLTIWQELGNSRHRHDRPSKGASGVSGAKSFITLAATLAIVPGHSDPVARHLARHRQIHTSRCRAPTNLIGNGVAAASLSADRKVKLDKDALHEAMARPISEGEGDGARRNESRYLTGRLRK